MRQIGLMGLICPIRPICSQLLTHIRPATRPSGCDLPKDTGAAYIL